MSVVTDIIWICPGCGSREAAQILGHYEDLPPGMIPTECGGMRWNPPCEECGNFRLTVGPFVTTMTERLPAKDATLPQGDEQ